MSEDNDDVGVALACFVLGTAVGACTALLFAPGTGKATRAELARRLHEAKGTLTDFASEFAELTQQVADAVDSIGGNVTRTRDYFSKKVGAVTG